jgi:quinoprotein glucose dehydrogenase
MDNHIRAFDVESGVELWRADLPAGGQATPMTYVAGGRQYLVIAAGGHNRLGTTRAIRSSPLHCQKGEAGRATR